MPLRYQSWERTGLLPTDLRSATFDPVVRNVSVIGTNLNQIDVLPVVVQQKSGPEHRIVLALFPCALCQYCKEDLRLPRGGKKQVGEQGRQHLPDLSLQFLEHLI